LQVAEQRRRNGDWLRPRCLSPFRLRPGTPGRELGALRSPLVLIFVFVFLIIVQVFFYFISFLKTPHPNPLPGVPGRGDKTLAAFNFVVFGFVGVLGLTRHEDRLPRLLGCRTLPIPRLEGPHHS
jgi:hypothetical protein